MEKRPFGKTGESFPILSFGGQRIVDEHNCTEEEAVKIVNTAIDRGIRYFDTAWVYSDGQAETRLGKVVRQRRSEMWIDTKTWDTSRDGAQRQLETSLRRLQTDYVDEWRLHCVYDYARLDAFTGKGGGLEAAVKAREEGLVRYISITSHTDPQILVEALKRFPFDSALMPLSALDHSGTIRRSGTHAGEGCTLRRSGIGSLTTTGCVLVVRKAARTSWATQNDPK